MKEISLYKIANEYQSLLNHLYDHETGEINQAIQEKIDELEPSAEKKCIAVASYIKKMESEKREIDFLKNELAAREKSYEKEINRLHDYLKYNMERCKIKEINCPYFTIKLKINPPSTDILDESIIPEEYMRKKEIIKTEIKPDKIAIKENVLKTGIQIPGAIVSQKTQVKISIDKL